MKCSTFELGLTKIHKPMALYVIDVSSECDVKPYTIPRVGRKKWDIIVSKKCGRLQNVNIIGIKSFMKNFTLSWVTLLFLSVTDRNNKDFLTSGWQFQSVNELAGRLFAFQMPTANFPIQYICFNCLQFLWVSFSFSKPLRPSNYYWQARIKKLQTDVGHGTGKPNDGFLLNTLKSLFRLSRAEYS